jgi:hypothetical protein
MLKLMALGPLPRVGLLLTMLAGAFAAAGCGSSTDASESLGSAGTGAASAGSSGGAGQAGNGTAGAVASGAGSAPLAAGGALSGAGGAHPGGAGASASGASGANFGGSAGSAAAGTSGSNGSAGAGAAGAAGANGGASGMAGSAGSGGSTANTDYLKTRPSSYGFVNIAASSKNQILSFSTTLTVPMKPKANTGTLFLWPGLQPGGANYDPIDNGVLQPVLTWGPTCAPTSPKNSYASWWISAQYVNTFGSDAGYTGCLGGTGMNVQTGEALQIVMTLNGTVWHQAVTDTANAQSVSYDLDMLGQAQNYAEFVIEQYTQDPATDVIFTATTVTFEKAEAASCQPSMRGMNDFFTNPKASADGKQCTIDRIVLRAQGIAATSPN